jgi:hypothetical protein
MASKMSTSTDTNEQGTKDQATKEQETREQETRDPETKEEAKHICFVCGGTNWLNGYGAQPKEYICSECYRWRTYHANIISDLCLEQMKADMVKSGWTVDKVDRCIDYFDREHAALRKILDD